jgi:hypothetical protein
VALSCSDKREAVVALMAFTIRQASAADVPECGRICYDAFADIAARHGFPPDFASVSISRLRWCPG